MTSLKRIGPHPYKDEGHQYRMTLVFDDGTELSQLVVFKEEDVRKFLDGAKYCGSTWYDYICSDVLYRKDDRIGVYLNVHRSWDEFEDESGDDVEYLLLSKKVSDELLTHLEKLL